jgi:hypothetical protein
MSQRHPERHTVSQRQAAPGECFDQPTYVTRKRHQRGCCTSFPKNAKVLRRCGDKTAVHSPDFPILRVPGCLPECVPGL